MKKFLLALLFSWMFAVSAQKIDTVIHTAAYTSYYSIGYKEPLFVSYVLYHGGGECSRKGMHFKNDTKLVTANLGDYAKTGYDQGHLANAEDFANDCVKEELTFRFYNCLPQTPNLNRGIWKAWETELRKDSQTDSLLVLCGGVFETKKVIGNGVWVPTQCWKVVKSLSTNKIICCLLFTNTDVAVMKTTTVQDLQKLLGYKLPLGTIKK